VQVIAVGCQTHSVQLAGLTDQSKAGTKCSAFAAPLLRSIVVQDRAKAAVLGELCIAAEAEQVEVEGLASLLLAVALDFNRDGLRRLAGAKVSVPPLAT
jgi:hypothetical protein